MVVRKLEGEQLPDSGIKDGSVGQLSQTVILIAGPAGAGKTSMGRRIATVPGWIHIPEDSIWDELPRDRHVARTESEREIVQSRAIERIMNELQRGNSVILEFVLYDDPPQPILYYSGTLTASGVSVQIRVLRPSIETLLSRQAKRGNSHDLQALPQRRANAEHQIRCLRGQHIDPSWVIASSSSSIEEIYQEHFAHLVEPAPGRE